MTNLTGRTHSGVSPTSTMYLDSFIRNLAGCLLETLLYRRRLCLKLKPIEFMPGVLDTECNSHNGFIGIQALIHLRALQF